MKLFKSIKPILSGIEIGIPLNIISKISTDVNFPTSIITKESILINFLLGFATYKQDRYLDALENNLLNYSNSKNLYYNSLLDNEKFIQYTLFCSYITILILTFSLNNDLKIITPLFLSTFLYKYCKKNKNLSFLKPFYVASLWTVSTCIIPLILNDNYNIDYINFSLLAPPFLNLFALTNLADLKDYDEDLNNEIYTLPIIFGRSKIKTIILFSSILSTILFIDSPYYLNNIQNIIYLSSNIVPYFSLLNVTN